MCSIKGINYKNGEVISITLDHGLIESIVSAEDTFVGERLPFIAPGLVDLQVNGYKNIDFNSLSTTVEDIITITKELLSKGVTTYFPTVITNSSEVIKACLATISYACSQSKLVNSCIGGIHLEGPFISPQEGPVGAHNKQFVQAPDWDLFTGFNKAASSRIKIVTISPEWPNAPAFTEQCVRNGIIVSIGHTAANTEEIEAVVNAGAKMSTHLGNGTHQVLPRHPNYIWDQLANEKLHACFIADKFHLPTSVIQVITKVKGSRAILVSDSVSLAGMPPGFYQTPVGGNVVLTDDGKLHLANRPDTLAGSAQTLLQSVNNLINTNLYLLKDALEMASANQAELLNIPQRQGLQPGAPADLILFFRNDSGIEIIKTYKNGIKVFPSERFLTSSK